MDEEKYYQQKIKEIHRLFYQYGFGEDVDFELFWRKRDDDSYDYVFIHRPWDHDYDDDKYHVEYGVYVVGDDYKTHITETHEKTCDNIDEVADFIKRYLSELGKRSYTHKPL